MTVRGRKTTDAVAVAMKLLPVVSLKSGGCARTIEEDYTSLT